MRITGRALCLGDDINTDVIIPSKYLRTKDRRVFGEHALEGLEGYKERIQRGDVIIAGKNFGCGSSREQAPIALKEAGISCVVAESFARIFFRNAINVGLPLMEVKVNCVDGEPIEVDLDKGTISFSRTKETVRGLKLPPFLLEILKDGGLVAHRKKEEFKDDNPR